MLSLAPGYLSYSLDPGHWMPPEEESAGTGTQETWCSLSLPRNCSCPEG